MAFCKKCGNQLEDGASFCPKCGESVSGGTGATNGKNAFSFITDTPDRTAEFSAKDIEDNKVMGILAYISILVLVPVFAAKDSPYVRFHANQGLILFLAGIAFSVACSLLSGIFALIHLGFLISIISYAGSLIFFAAAVWMIVTVAMGKAKELPFIGNIKIIK